MIIPVIGPSKAGKTETTKELVRAISLRGPLRLERIDLDDLLGPSARSDGERAVSLVTSFLTTGCIDRCLLVDVGAGQLASPVFADYLGKFPDYPSSVVAIWCDEQTFRNRHGKNASNEVGRYYGPTSKLAVFWNDARSAGRLVNTSGAYDPALWAERLCKKIDAIIEST